MKSRTLFRKKKVFDPPVSGLCRAAEAPVRAQRKPPTVDPSAAFEMRSI